MPGPYDSYPARTKTYAPLDPVASAELNAIQDGVIATSDNLDVLAAITAANETASGNDSDSPAPDPGGGGTMWCEQRTNGTTVIVLDNSIDWRDRFVILTVYMIADATAMPGGANDALFCRVDLKAASAAYHEFFYSRDGKSTATTDASEAARMLLTADYVLVAARNTDGALVLYKDANADGDRSCIIRAEYSPVQNHY